MDLNSYYLSYQTSLRKDSLPGFAEYAAKQPLKSQKFPTFEAYIKDVVNNIKMAISHNNEKEFGYWLVQHKKGIFQLQNKILTERAPKDPLFYGWRGFKFSTVKFNYPDKGYSFVPWASMIAESPGVNMCAEEMELIHKHWTLLDPVYDWKSEGPCYIMVKDGRLLRTSIERLNLDSVIEWSAKLRYED